VGGRHGIDSFRVFEECDWKLIAVKEVLMFSAVCESFVAEQCNERRVMVTMKCLIGLV
jgi:hypothetical protein